MANSNSNCETYKYISTVFFILAFSILVYRVYRTKDVRNLSYTWVLFVVMSQLFLMTHGICNNKPEAILSSTFILAGVLYIFSLKLRTDHVDEENKKIIEQLRNKDIL
jgi:hypothetical protein